METVAPLQPQARALLGFLAAHPEPPLDDRTIAAARAAVIAAQGGAQAATGVQVEQRSIAGVPAYVYRPEGVSGPLPAALYFHGGGWALCDHRTHDRLMRELAAAAQVAMVFVEYSRAPEARYPVALEQAYASACSVAAHGAEMGLDGSRLAVSGDSAGANLATVVARMAKGKGGPALRFQLLFFPVTDAAMDTASYREFAEGYFLTRAQMRWFWDAYAPDPEVRRDPALSPLRAPLEDLRGLPESLVITADHDVLRDEGEAYARRLAAAGVPVTLARYPGTIHAFVVLDAIAADPSPRLAVAQAAAALKRSLLTGFQKPRAASSLSTCS